jgi:hypothetical protein
MLSIRKIPGLSNARDNQEPNSKQQEPIGACDLDLEFHLEPQIKN